jgi:hypothetical protein
MYQGMSAVYHFYMVIPYQYVLKKYYPYKNVFCQFIAIKIASMLYYSEESCVCQ